MARLRLLELDGLRGIAALWVVLYHFTSGVKTWLGDQAGTALAYTPTVINLYGVMAVHLFFIVSGFVISLTIGRCRSVHEFVAGRVARLYPAYWAGAIVAALIATFMPAADSPVTPWQCLINLTMLQEYVGVRDINPSFWSLAVELGFYVVAAAVLALRQVRRIEAIGFVWLVASFVTVTLLPMVSMALPWRAATAVGLLNAPLFYAGILFYRIWSDRLTWLRAAGVALCLALEFPGVGGPGTTMGLIEIANFFGVALAITGRFTLLRHAVLQFLGKISYSLYVLHAVLGFRLQTWLHEAGVPPTANLLITLAAVIALSAVVTAHIERPGGRLVWKLYHRLIAARRAPVRELAA